MKLDENLPDAFASVLQEGGHDVALARDEGLAGATDDVLLTTATTEHRALVSLDRDFSNILRQAPFTDVTPQGPDQIFGESDMTLLLEALALVRATAIAA